MKLRSGRIRGTMIPESHVIADAAFALNQLYKIGENLMTCPEKADEVEKPVASVNEAYDYFVSQCSHLSIADVIPGTFCTKLDFETGYWEFKQRVQQWYDEISSRGLNKAPKALETSSLNGKFMGYRKSWVPFGVDTTKVNSMPDLSPNGRTFEVFKPPLVSGTFALESKSQMIRSFQNAELRGSSVQGPSAAVILSEDVGGYTMPDSEGFNQFYHASKGMASFKISDDRFRSTSCRPHTSHLTAFRPTSSGELPWPSQKTEGRKSKRSKSSRCSTVSSASRLEEARIKLQLARLRKDQNEIRMREEEKREKELLATEAALKCK